MRKLKNALIVATIAIMIIDMLYCYNNIFSYKGLTANGETMVRISVLLRTT